MMNISGRILMATVALERNRWGSKEPSFLVSEWMNRFESDGFDGIELWENHYLLAGVEEQERLEACGSVEIFNSYAGFDDAGEESRAKAADAVKRLNARGVKYNFGYKSEMLDEYRRNLLQWETSLPEGCALLCECHQGTALETIEASKKVFDGLDPERFGVMVHCSGVGGAEAWLDAFGKRVQHVHIQLRGDESDPSSEEGRAALREGLGVFVGNGFEGSFSLEFTRGIGKNEDIEVIYANACSDLREIRAALDELTE